MISALGAAAPTCPMISAYDRLKRLYAGLLPAACVLCAAPLDRGPHFCAACARALPRPAHHCPVCAAPAATETAAPCGQCQRRPPPYDRVRAPFRYGPPVDRLVQGAKYSGRLDWLAVLAHQLLRHVQASPQVELLVPVPLHRARLRDRGYNQSLELARPVARALRLPLRHALARVRATRAQTGLPAVERRANLRDAFAPIQALAGEPVALVDDVMTSGATAEAAAASLRAAGAARVEVWVVARA